MNKIVIFREFYSSFIRATLSIFFLRAKFLLYCLAGKPQIVSVDCKDR